MSQNILISPIVGNNPLNTYQISTYVHKCFSAFSRETNIDTSVSSMGIRTNASRFGGYEVLVPKKNPSVEMTVAHYRNHVKPILQNSLNMVRNHAEKEFIELQNRICFDIEKAKFNYCRPDSMQQELAYFNLIYESLKMEYQNYAFGNYHFLYHVGIMGFKDKGAFLTLHIVPYSLPSIVY